MTRLTLFYLNPDEYMSICDMFEAWDFDYTNNTNTYLFKVENMQ